MRIAEVGPLFFPVPPPGYGGVARLVSYLTEELVSRGHEVTLFASGDSRTRARLIAQCAEATGFGKDPGWHDVIMRAIIARHSDEFDVIHFHEVGGGLHHLPLVRLIKTPCVLTYHLALPVTPANTAFFREFADVPAISLSHAQRRPAPWLNWQATIYHGLPSDLYRFREHAKQYLAFIGRVCRHKKLEDAIRISQISGWPLKVAGRPMTSDDHSYFNSLLRTRGSAAIEYVGEIGDTEKQAFLGGASALLLPLGGDEPGPVTAIEGLACGTPVIGYRRSFIPEVIMDGVSGFVVDNVDTAVQALSAVESVSRKQCREQFEKRFAIRDKCEEYIAVFEKLVAGADEQRSS